MSFKPNDMKEEDIDKLEDWKLLVAACHYGPTMGDCIELNYEYRIENGEVFCIGIGHNEKDVSLRGDIDLDRPMDALSQYAGVSWRDLAKDSLRKILDEREKEKL